MYLSEHEQGNNILILISFIVVLNFRDSIINTVLNTKWLTYKIKLNIGRQRDKDSLKVKVWRIISV